MEWKSGNSDCCKINFYAIFVLFLFCVYDIKPDLWDVIYQSTIIEKGFIFVQNEQNVEVNNLEGR